MMRTVSGPSALGQRALRVRRWFGGSPLVAAAALALLCGLCLPARAATATLYVDEFNGASGYADLACTVNLTDNTSTWHDVYFHVNLLGTWISDSGEIDTGAGGPGDFRYPPVAGVYWRYAWFPGAQAGTFDVYAVAHGFTTHTYPNPPTPWSVSTTEQFFSYP